MSNPKKITVGIAGTGFVAPAHVEALRRISIRVKGVCGSTVEKAQAKAAEWGLEKAYESFEAMISDPEIAAVHLATPNVLHFSQAKAALLAGKHVVCEKPFTVNSQEAIELVELVKRTGKIGAVNFNLRYYPLCFQARSLVQQQELGRIYMVHGSYLQDWLVHETDWNWRLDPAQNGPLRTVGDVGSHWLDMVTFVTGLEVEALCADFQTFLPLRKKPAGSVETFSGKIQKSGATIDQAVQSEDYAAVLLRFKGGGRGSFTISQMSAGRKNRLAYEINGAQASLAWNSERPDELWIGHRDQPNELLFKDPALLSNEARQHASYPGGHNEGYPDTFKQLYKNIYDYAVKGDFASTPPFPTFEDGLRQVKLGEAIYTSAMEGRWVQV